MPRGKDASVREIRVPADAIAALEAGMRPSHTPGPWVAINTGWGQSIIRPRDDGGCAEIVIAAVYRGGLLYSAIDQGAANVRLIAAAPDLLGAAEAFLALADDPPVRGTVERFAAGLAALRAAVAKARGKEVA
jgi:hypothetical protein